MPLAKADPTGRAGPHPAEPTGPAAVPEAAATPGPATGPGPAAVRPLQPRRRWGPPSSASASASHATGFTIAVTDDSGGSWQELEQGMLEHVVPFPMTQWSLPAGAGGDDTGGGGPALVVLPQLPAVFIPSSAFSSAADERPSPSPSDGATALPAHRILPGDAGDLHAQPHAHMMLVSYSTYAEFAAGKGRARAWAHARHRAGDEWVVVLLPPPRAPALYKGVAVSEEAAGPGAAGMVAGSAAAPSPPSPTTAAAAASRRPRPAAGLLVGGAVVVAMAGAVSRATGGRVDPGGLGGGQTSLDNPLHARVLERMQAECAPAGGEHRIVRLDVAERWVRRPEAKRRKRRAAAAAGSVAGAADSAPPGPSCPPAAVFDFRTPPAPLDARAEAAIASQWSALRTRLHAACYAALTARVAAYAKAIASDFAARYSRYGAGGGGGVGGMGALGGLVGLGRGLLGAGGRGWLAGAAGAVGPDGPAFPSSASFATSASSAPWSFPAHFRLKEGLAFTLARVRLLQHALRLYDELESAFTAVSAQSATARQPGLGAGAGAARDDAAQAAASLRRLQLAPLGRMTGGAGALPSGPPGSGVSPSTLGLVPSIEAARTVAGVDPVAPFLGAGGKVEIDEEGDLPLEEVGVGAGSSWWASTVKAAERDVWGELVAGARWSTTPAAAAAAAAAAVATEGPAPASPAAASVGTSRPPLPTHVLDTSDAACAVVRESLLLSCCSAPGPLAPASPPLALLDLRRYIFARQAALLTTMRHSAELAVRARDFLGCAAEILALCLAAGGLHPPVPAAVAHAWLVCAGCDLVEAVTRAGPTAFGHDLDAPPDAQLDGSADWSAAISPAAAEGPTSPGGRSSGRRRSVLALQATCTAEPLAGARGRAASPPSPASLGAEGGGAGPREPPPRTLHQPPSVGRISTSQSHLRSRAASSILDIDDIGILPGGGSGAVSSEGASHHPCEAEAMAPRQTLFRLPLRQQQEYGGTGSGSGGSAGDGAGSGSAHAAAVRFARPAAGPLVVPTDKGMVDGLTEENEGPLGGARHVSDGGGGSDGFAGDGGGGGGAGAFSAGMTIEEFAAAGGRIDAVAVLDGSASSSSGGSYAEAAESGPAPSASSSSPVASAPLPRAQSPQALLQSAVSQSAAEQQPAGTPWATSDTLLVRVAAASPNGAPPAASPSAAAMAAAATAPAAAAQKIQPSQQHHQRNQRRASSSHARRRAANWSDARMAACMADLLTVSIESLDALLRIRAREVVAAQAAKAAAAKEGAPAAGENASGAARAALASSSFAAAAAAFAASASTTSFFSEVSPLGPFFAGRAAHADFSGASVADRHPPPGAHSAAAWVLAQALAVFPSSSYASSRPAGSRSPAWAHDILLRFQLSLWFSAAHYRAAAGHARAAIALDARRAAALLRSGRATVALPLLLDLNVQSGERNDVSTAASCLASAAVAAVATMDPAAVPLLWRLLDPRARRETTAVWAAAAATSRARRAGAGAGAGAGAAAASGRGEEKRVPGPFSPPPKLLLDSYPELPSFLAPAGGVQAAVWGGGAGGFSPASPLAWAQWAWASASYVEALQRASAALTASSCANTPAASAPLILPARPILSTAVSMRGPGLHLAASAADGSDAAGGGDPKTERQKRLERLLVPRPLIAGMAASITVYVASALPVHFDVSSVEVELRLVRDAADTEEGGKEHKRNRGGNDGADRSAAEGEACPMLFADPALLAVHWAPPPPRTLSGKAASAAEWVRLGPGRGQEVRATGLRGGVLSCRPRVAACWKGGTSASGGAGDVDDGEDVSDDDDESEVDGGDGGGVLSSPSARTLSSAPARRPTVGGPPHLRFGAAATLRRRRGRPAVTFYSGSGNAAHAWDSISSEAGCDAHPQAGGLGSAPAAATSPAPPLQLSLCTSTSPFSVAHASRLGAPTLDAALPGRAAAEARSDRGSGAVRLCAGLTTVRFQLPHLPSEWTAGGRIEVGRVRAAVGGSDTVAVVVEDAAPTVLAGFHLEQLLEAEELAEAELHARRNRARSAPVPVPPATKKQKPPPRDEFGRLIDDVRWGPDDGGDDEIGGGGAGPRPRRQAAAGFSASSPTLHAVRAAAATGEADGVRTRRSRRSRRRDGVTGLSRTQRRRSSGVALTADSDVSAPATGLGSSSSSIASSTLSSSSSSSSLSSEGGLEGRGDESGSEGEGVGAGARGRDVDRDTDGDAREEDEEAEGEERTGEDSSAIGSAPSGAIFSHATGRFSPPYFPAWSGPPTVVRHRSGVGPAMGGPVRPFEGPTPRKHAEATTVHRNARRSALVGGLSALTKAPAWAAFVAGLRGVLPPHGGPAHDHPTPRAGAIVDSPAAALPAALRNLRFPPPYFPMGVGARSLSSPALVSATAEAEAIANQDSPQPPMAMAAAEDGEAAVASSIDESRLIGGGGSMPALADSRGCLAVPLLGRTVEGSAAADPWAALACALPSPARSHTSFGGTGFLLSSSLVDSTARKGLRFPRLADSTVPPLSPAAGDGSSEPEGAQPLIPLRWFDDLDAAFHPASCAIQAPPPPLHVWVRARAPAVEPSGRPLPVTLPYAPALLRPVLVGFETRLALLCTPGAGIVANAAAASEGGGGDADFLPAGSVRLFIDLPSGLRPARLPPGWAWPDDQPGEWPVVSIDGVDLGMDVSLLDAAAVAGMDVAASSSNETSPPSCPRSRAAFADVLLVPSSPVRLHGRFGSGGGGGCGCGGGGGGGGASADPASPMRLSITLRCPLRLGEYALVTLPVVALPQGEGGAADIGDVASAAFTSSLAGAALPSAARAPMSFIPAVDVAGARAAGVRLDGTFLSRRRRRDLAQHQAPAAPLISSSLTSSPSSSASVHRPPLSHILRVGFAADVDVVFSPVSPPPFPAGTARTHQHQQASCEFGSAVLSHRHPHRWSFVDPAFPLPAYRPFVAHTRVIPRADVASALAMSAAGRSHSLGRGAAGGGPPLVSVPGWPADATALLCRAVGLSVGPTGEVMARLPSSSGAGALFSSDSSSLSPTSSSHFARGRRTAVPVIFRASAPRRSAASECGPAAHRAPQPDPAPPHPLHRHSAPPTAASADERERGGEGGLAWFDDLLRTSTKPTAASSRRHSVENGPPSFNPFDNPFEEEDGEDNEGEAAAAGTTTFVRSSSPVLDLPVPASDDRGHHIASARSLDHLREDDGCDGPAPHAALSCANTSAAGWDDGENAGRLFEGRDKDEDEGDAGGGLNESVVRGDSSEEGDEEEQAEEEAAEQAAAMSATRGGQPRYAGGLGAGGNFSGGEGDDDDDDNDDDDDVDDDDGGGDAFYASRRAAADSGGRGGAVAGSASALSSGSAVVLVQLVCYAPSPFIVLDLGLRCPSGSGWSLAASTAPAMAGCAVEPAAAAAGSFDDSQQQQPPTLLLALFRFRRSISASVAVHAALRFEWAAPSSSSCLSPGESGLGRVARSTLPHGCGNTRSAGEGPLMGRGRVPVLIRSRSSSVSSSAGSVGGGGCGGDSSSGPTYPPSSSSSRRGSRRWSSGSLGAAAAAAAAWSGDGEEAAVHIVASGMAEDVRLSVLQLPREGFVVGKV